MQWGAFAPNKEIAIPGVDAEIADYLLATYLDCHPDEPGIESRIREALTMLGHDVEREIPLIDWLESMIPVIQLLIKCGSTDQVRKLWLEAPAQMALLPLVLRCMTDLQKHDVPMETPGAINAYRLIMDPGPNGEVENAVRFLLPKLDALIPFAAMDEVCDIAQATPYSRDTAFVFTFYSSARAAQALAESLPSHTIINSLGVALTPG
jgi:hypothetical protein